jgi:hypothetical protein
MEGVPNLPPHLQGEFMKQMENMQMKDSLRCADDYLLICDRDIVAFCVLTNDDRVCSRK